MTTDAQRRATAAFLERRAAEGLKKVTLWLSEEARAALDALKSREVSKDKIADRAILAYRDGSGKAERLDVPSVSRRVAAPRKDAEAQPSTQSPEVKREVEPRLNPAIDVAARFAAFNAQRKDKP